MKAIDSTIARIAADHNRVVSWRHLVAAGVNSDAIRHRLEIGRLYRIHHGVYLLEPPIEASRLTLLTAAVHACAPNAFLSHQSAAELWQLAPQRAGPIHVTVVGRNPGTRRQRLRIHRSTTLTRKDVRSRRRVPATSPTRTIRDLAPALDRDELELMVATAHRLGLVSGNQLAADPSFTRSKAEQLLLSLVRKANLPNPRTNARILGYEVDFLWPKQRLIVEIDGFEFHADRRSFERDRARDAKLIAAGYRVIRFTWRALRERPFETIARIAQALVQ